ncbi:MAG: hypothetical protein DHS20C21_00260 [Gemmatimonadota bacterium]|nr:MAG: hypothetical protein DHS20C21_00260 [Gemmatimonadota bacterium]
MANGHGRLALLVGVMATTLSPPATAQEPATLGLDHIPVVVADLERARTTFLDLGFALKPGRDHANGIRNAHVKFPNGAGIELLTASSAVDPLSTHYVNLLRAGEGPAFASFHARDTQQLHAALREGGYEFRTDGEITELRSPGLAFLFIVRDNRSPTDRPEHFAHPNGAMALTTVWIATEHGDALARLLVRLGGRQRRQQVLAPNPTAATVVSLAEGEVFILPKGHQVLAGRPVIGASFTVRDLLEVRQRLLRAQIQPWQGSDPAERVVVEPKVAHGMWIEFLEGP